MTQPNMPNLPGFDAMADTLEFVKNMWGGMQAPTGMPGMVMPTLSVEEINKQIADLKAVESWLNVNMNMLRGTIQALEVQSATLATLHAMGQTFGAGMPQGANANAAPNKADAAAASHASASAADPLLATAAAGTPEAWWNMLQAQFNQAVSSVMAEEKPAAPKKEKPATRATRAPSAAAKKTAAKSGAKPRKKSAPPGKP